MSLPKTGALSRPEEAVVQVREIYKTFAGGVLALDHISLDVYKGEVLVIIGPSGSGKSTLLRCLNGLEAIDSGSIVINGIPLDKTRPTAWPSAGKWVWYSSPSIFFRT